jgi:hypothetical protein
VSLQVPVYLEVGAKRVFASAIDWPGWSRGARSEDQALESLAAYRSRYAKVTKRARLEFAAPGDPSSFKVVERLKGNTGTDFGVPTLEAATDGKKVGDAELERLRGILRACWESFDLTARAAKGKTLRKGPRGGGRDLDKIVGHVVEAEEAYIVQLGAKRPKDGDAARSRLRELILETLSARALGRPISEPSRAKTLWTPRYFVRRAAWHVLDHLWEIEDRM